MTYLKKGDVMIKEKSNWLCFKYYPYFQYSKTVR